jgi:hypothetical protein
MRTDPSDGTRPIAARLRSALDPARRWLGGLGLVGRLGVCVGLLAILASVVQLATQGRAPEPAWLFGGQRFPSDQASRIVRALAARSIAAQVVGGRVEVARSELTAAHLLLEKAGLAPQSPRELLDALPVSGLLPTQAELEQRAQRRHARILEAEVREIDETLAATVWIHRSRSRGLDPVETLRVTVELEAPDDRPIDAEVIERIRTKLLNLEPDLKPEGLTIIDRKGTAYVLADNPELVEQSRLRARQEQLRAAILGQLDWIPGVRVQVRFRAEPPPAPPPGATAPTIAVNTPVLEEPAITEPEPAASGRATVVVRVPDTYYRGHFHDVSPRRTLSEEDMVLFVARTEDSIRSAVALAVPEGELGELFIDRIYEVPQRARALVPSSPQARWLDRGWLAAAGVALGLAGLASLGRLARRPAARAGQTAPGRRPARVDAATSPAQRVRDLVKLDTAAAAGVLQRWIAQGGGRDA